MAKLRNVDKKSIHKKIRIRLWLYLAIFFLGLGLTIYYGIKDQIPVLYLLAGTAVGIILGMLVSRMQKISWDEAKEQVVAKLDALGIVILVLYILFTIFRNTLVHLFVHLPHINAISFSIMAGIMLGRVLRIRRKVLRALAMDEAEEE